MYATVAYTNGQTGAIQVSVKKDEKIFEIIKNFGKEEKHEFICVGKVSVLKTNNCKTV